MDLSSPHDRIVKDGVPEDMSSLQYVTVEEAAVAMVHKGGGALLAKVDMPTVTFQFTLTTVGCLESYGKMHCLLILCYLSDLGPPQRYSTQ